MNRIYIELLQIIGSHSVPIREVEELKKDNNLIDDLGIDSLQLMNIIVSLEDHYDIRIDDEFLTPDNFSNIKNVYNVLESILNSHSR